MNFNLPLPVILPSLRPRDTEGLPPAVEAMLRQAPFRLIHRRRLSHKRLRELMGLGKAEAARDETFHVTVSRISDLLRRDGFLPRPPCETAALDGDAEILLDRAVLYRGQSRTQLLAGDRPLYEAITNHPQRETIYARAGVRHLRGGLMDQSDEDILSRCGGYSSLTDLHYANNALAREVRRRTLTAEVVRRHGWMTFAYVTPAGLMVRSLQEAIVANLLTAAGIPFEYDLPVPGQQVPQGAKPIRYDFRIPSPQGAVYIECLQQPAGRLTCDRHREYGAQWARKAQIYRELRLDLLTCCMEDFPQRVDAPREVAFAQHLAQLLAARGYDLAVPTRAVLMANSKLNVIGLSVADILDGLLPACAGIADLQNNHSTLNSLLKQRDDYAEIRAVLKARGIAIRGEANRQRHARNRQAYWPFGQARDFVRGLGLKGQREWFDWCAGRMPTLPARPAEIPTAPRLIYPDDYAGLADWLGYDAPANRPTA